MFYLSNIKRRNALDLANYILTETFLKKIISEDLGQNAVPWWIYGEDRRFTRTTGNIRENLED